MRRGRGHDRLPGAGLAGERDAGHARMRDQRRTRHLADAVDQVEHPVGQASLGHDLRQQAGRKRRPLGRLEHHRAARRQRGRELPGFQHERRVPRGDQAGHPGRLTDHVAELRGAGPERVLVQGHHHVGEEAEVLRRPGRLAAGLGDRQAGVERLEFGDPVRASLDTGRDPVQDLRPFASGQAGPRSFGERGGGGGGRPVHVLRPACRHGGIRLVADRVGDLEGDAVRAFAGLAGDEVLERGGEPGRRVHWASPCWASQAA